MARRRSFRDSIPAKIGGTPPICRIGTSTSGLNPHFSKRQAEKHIRRRTVASDAHGLALELAVVLDLRAHDDRERAAWSPMPRIITVSLPCAFTRKTGSMPWMPIGVVPLSSDCIAWEPAT